MTDSPGRYEEVYAIIRIDAAALQHRRQARAKDFLVVKVMRSQEMAREEVDRLNGIGKTKGHFYYFQVTRLEKYPADPTAESAPASPE